MNIPPTAFDDLIKTLLIEAEQPPMPPSDGGEGGDTAMPDDAGQGEEMPPDDMGVEEEEPLKPEELELAKFAVRAINFNIKSKDVHKLSLKYQGHTIPFEKISDFFEQTKAVKPVLGFLEHMMNKYEGLGSKWTEQPEVAGKKITDKIDAFNAVANPDEKLDNGKRVYWVRIILNALLKGDPSYNLVTSDVTPESLPEIFNKLKMDFGYDTRGLRKQLGLRGPGVF